MKGYARLFQFWIFLLATPYLSLTSGPPDALDVFSDKIIHFVGYFLLMLSCDFAYWPGRKLLGKILFLFGFSTIIEMLQHFIPYRQFYCLDILANLTGLTWGLLFIVYLIPKVERFAKKQM